MRIIRGAGAPVKRVHEKISQKVVNDMTEYKNFTLIKGDNAASLDPMAKRRENKKERRRRIGSVIAGTVLTLQQEIARAAEPSTVISFHEAIGSNYDRIA